MLSLLRLERKLKKYSTSFRIRIFLFLFLFIGIETINAFIRSRSSLENHTPIPDQNGQSVSDPFSDQNGAKTLPDGAPHTYIAYIREYPPGRAEETITLCDNRDNLIMFGKIFCQTTRFFKLICL